MVLGGIEGNWHWWIFSAARPLDPRELQEAVALEEDDTTIEPDYLTDESALIDICCGLVSIDENSRTVRFVHYSVQEYFESNPAILHGSHAMIAKTCVTYLSLDRFAETPKQDRENEWLQSRVEGYPLYNYAARNWCYHTCFVEQDTQVLDKLIKFSRSGPRVQTALHLFFIPAWVPYSQYPFTQNPHGILSVAARVGSLHLVKFCLDRCGMPADSTHRNHEVRPLSLAADNGHAAVVRFLAERGDVDVDSTDYAGKTALAKAAANGHEAIVRILAARDDVDADRGDGFGITPLAIAAHNGHEDIVRFLADRPDVDADSKDNFGETPLYEAARRGHAGVVAYLAERDDVNVNYKRKNGTTALGVAAMMRHKAIVELLEDRIARLKEGGSE